MRDTAPFTPHSAATLAAVHGNLAPDTSGYWLSEARRLEWSKFPSVADRSSFAETDFGVRCFADMALNESVNCLDRHLAARGHRTAIRFGGDESTEGCALTYRELHREVCLMANVLKRYGVGKRDRVTVYLLMIPESAIAMLACARIGAIHSVVFGGFSPDSLAGRIQDCDSKLLITACEGVRGGKRVPLTGNADEALESCPGVETVVLVKRTGGEVAYERGRDVCGRRSERKSARFANPSR